VQCADLSVAVEELELEDEEGGEYSVPPQLRSRLVPLTPPLHLASLSKYDRKQTSSDYDVARNPSYQRLSYKERGGSTPGFNSSVRGSDQVTNFVNCITL
jgi:hypothetical protein